MDIGQAIHAMKAGMTCRTVDTPDLWLHETADGKCIVMANHAGYKMRYDLTMEDVLNESWAVVGSRVDERLDEFVYRRNRDSMQSVAAGRKPPA